MKVKTITALMVEPGKPPHAVRLYTHGHHLEYAVSVGASYLCTPSLAQLSPTVSILYNGEATILGLPRNRRIEGLAVAGVFYLVGTDEEGNLTSLAHNDLDDFWIYLSAQESYLEGEASVTDITDALFSDTLIL